MKNLWETKIAPRVGDGLLHLLDAGAAATSNPTGTLVVFCLGLVVGLSVQ